MTPTSEIDFDKTNLVLVSRLNRPNGGYSVQIKTIEVFEEKIVVYVEETVPGPRCITTQVITSPYHLVSIPKMDKKIEFVSDKIVTDC